MLNTPIALQVSLAAFFVCFLLGAVLSFVTHRCYIVWRKRTVSGGPNTAQAPSKSSASTRTHEHACNKVDTSEETLTHPIDMNQFNSHETERRRRNCLVTFADDHDNEMFQVASKRAKENDVEALNETTINEKRKSGVDSSHLSATNATATNAADHTATATATSQAQTGANHRGRSRAASSFYHYNMSSRAANGGGRNKSQPNVLSRMEVEAKYMEFYKCQQAPLFTDYLHRSSKPFIGYASTNTTGWLTRAMMENGDNNATAQARLASLGKKRASTRF